MKIDLHKNLKGYDGLHSAVYSSYIIALSPLITAIIAIVATLTLGNTSKLGLLSAQIYTYSFVFVVLFLSIDLYRTILKERKFESFKTTLKTKPELFILLGFLVWNVIATLIQKAVFGSSYAYTTIVYPLGIQEGLFAFVIYGLCVLMAYFVKNKQITKNILFTFMIIVLALSIFATIDPMGEIMIFQSHRNTPWASMFFNSNHFGYVLTLATMLSAMWFIFAEKRWHKIFSTILLAAFIATGFMVDTFGSLIAVFFGFILIPIVLFWFKKKFNYTYLVPLGIFVILSFVMIPFAKLDGYSTYRSFFSQFIGLIKDIFIVSADIISSDPTSDLAKKAGTNRWGLWLMAFEEIKSSPIFGTGNVRLRPHNEYLQYAQVWGLPSMIIYISAFVVIFVKAIKNKEKLSNLSLSLIFCVGTYLISALFGNTMPHTIPFFALFLGFLVRWLNHDISEKTEEKEIKKEDIIK